MQKLVTKQEVSIHFEPPLALDQSDQREYKFHAVMAWNKHYGRYHLTYRKSAKEEWGEVYTSWFDLEELHEPERPRRFIDLDEGIWDNKTNTYLNSFKKIADFLEQEIER